MFTKKSRCLPTCFFRAAYLAAATRVAIAVIKAAIAIIIFAMYSAFSFVFEANYVHLPPWKDEFIITYQNFLTQGMKK
ncbi:hypothetical protein SAMN05446037_105316 [Anaerovirgula multivorans]|uniref:Uncharacterized protein n=1 Tax=Anaerovirgula multivorans TaxID=312168 RepID=A0A239KV30_9FIRM|nr:hypothetical protein SAMN05446037_105316 [Anaerovirgula multivorans]